MRKKSNIKRREVKPDPVYNSVLVSKFINIIMRNGKKTVAQKLVYSALQQLEESQNKPALELFEEILDKSRPTVMLKSRRVGGANIQVPVPVERQKGLLIAMRWIRDFARKRKGQPFDKDLLREFNDILTDQGDVLKKRDEIHKMAEANKTYAHFTR